MSDFFSKFEAELRSVARGSSPQSGRRRIGGVAGRSRRTALVVAVALAVVAVPAVAAVTGAFSNRPDPSPGTYVNLNPPCKGPSPAPPPLSSAPAPKEVTALVGVLRRPRTSADHIDVQRLPHLAGVNPATTRRAYVSPSGTRYFVVPAQNVNYSPPVPDTKACERYRRAQRPPALGACVIAVAKTSAASVCATVDDLRVKQGNGPSAGYSQSQPVGTVAVTGIVADGVRRVILEYPRGAPVRRVTIPVHNNVYAALFRGRPEVAPAVYFATASGIRLVQPGQQPTSRRQRELNRRSAERDRTATSRPTVMPPVGTGHTTFTFRMRVRNPKPGQLYVVRVRGPVGLCRNTVDAGIAPKLTGELRGLIKVGIGYGPLGLHRMCVGSYHGTVAVRASANAKRERLVTRFGFRVRAGRRS